MQEIDPIKAAERVIVSTAMSILGSRKSDAKTKAVRENAKRPRPRRKRKAATNQ